MVGESIALTPAVSGTVARYTVNPALPPGLSLNALSGVITGTPTKASAPAVFLVHASGAGVRASFPLVLSVTEPPSGLTYGSPAKAIMGVPLAPLRPTISGTVSHYAVSPTLPPGIVLDATSGIVSGVPLEARNLAAYTITASSLAGSTCFVLLLTVAAPAGHMLHLPGNTTPPSRAVHALRSGLSNKYPRFHDLQGESHDSSIFRSFLHITVHHRWECRSWKRASSPISGRYAEAHGLAIHRSGASVNRDPDRR